MQKRTGPGGRSTAIRESNCPNHDASCIIQAPNATEKRACPTRSPLPSRRGCSGARNSSPCAGQPLADYLGETLQHALEPLGDLSEANPEAWSDQEVLEYADSRMPEAEDRRLSELLQRQKAGRLQADEQGELTTLMAWYQRGLLRKSQGLREAVRRGLRPPVQP